MDTSPDSLEPWAQLYSRYRVPLLTYLWRAFRLTGGRPAEFIAAADRWLHLAFAGLTGERQLLAADDDFMHAALAGAAVRTVAAYRRSEAHARTDAFKSDVDPTISALLELLDVETRLRADVESANLVRDLLIFKLHFVEGLTPQQIAFIPSLDVAAATVEGVLDRLRRTLSPRKQD